MVTVGHITAPTPPLCPNMVTDVKLSQPQKEQLEPTILIWFGLFVFKGCLKTCQLLDSEYPVSSVFKNPQWEVLCLGCYSTWGASLPGHPAIFTVTHWLCFSGTPQEQYLSGSRESQLPLRSLSLRCDVQGRISEDNRISH